MTNFAAPTTVVHLSVAERVASGKDRRAEAPRSSHGAWEPAPDRRDPVAILSEQAADRVHDLVPIRNGRMAASSFAFYRGAAAIMAADLAPTPRTELEVQLCGDAHLANFGGFASPERTLLFDLNDFDETLPGPFEWDVKRLVASVEIAGRARGFPVDVRDRASRWTARAYREAMAGFASMTNLDVWYARMDIHELTRFVGDEIGSAAARRVGKVATRAATKDHMKALAKLTVMRDGERVFVSDPPLIVPIEELFAPEEAQDIGSSIHEALRMYRATLQPDRRHLLERYRITRVARKVVGVGSVGTRCWVVLLEGRDGDDPLFLQVKEATASVLEPYLGATTFAQHGERVVQGQRLTQAASDVFLGWHQTTGQDGVLRDFYLRQLWDSKASADLDSQSPELLVGYARVCGATLARAHARSGDPVAIAAYLGSGEVFDEALNEFGRRYAEQNESDHAAFVAAIAAGRVVATSGI